LIISGLSVVSVAVAQVTIGMSEKQVHGAVLQVKTVSDDAPPDSGGVSAYTGVVFPRVALTTRDSLIPMYSYISTDVPDAATQKRHRGLTVYNLTHNNQKDLYEGLYYWDGYKWYALQKGQGGAAMFEIQCGSSRALGAYVQDRELDETNRIKLVVNVTKTGVYDLLLESGNGYFFTASGFFGVMGIVTIYADGQGTPIDVQTDNITILSNGDDVSCTTPPLQVEVHPKTATFTFSCSRSVVKGVYKLHTALDNTNYIEVPVEVTSPTGGSYEFTTNTVGGISFYAEGDFPSAGNYTVHLMGSGAPTDTHVKTITITGHSAAGALSCDVKVITCYKRKTYAAIGRSEYGYTLGPNTLTTPTGSRVWEMFSAPGNFGPLDSSIVKIEGVSASDFKQVKPSQFSTTGTVGNLSTAELHSLLLEGDKPDICFLGYYNDALTVDQARIFRTYLDSGGVVIANIQLAATAARMIKGIFNLDYVTANQPTGRVFTLSGNYDDPVINGPFGNVNGKYWGADMDDLASLRNLPQDQFYIYSSGPSVYPASTTVPAVGDATMVRHKSLNFFWCGEGAWYATYYTPHPYTAESHVSPFSINTSTKKPTDRQGYGSPPSNAYPVSNSTLMANLLYWALTQAEYYGINKE
jgi:hypothetical protein